jgi:hypothetical protein
VSTVAVPAFSDGTAVPAAASPAADPDYFCIDREDGTYRILGVDLPPGSTIATCPLWPDMVGALMPISPAIAQEWLDRFNKENRGVKDASQEAWAEDVRHGRWIIDGNTVRFTPWGTDIELLDGQHRIGAIAEGTKTAWSWVVIGIDPAARWVIDSGNSRSVSDVLTMKHYKNPKTLQALSKRYPLYLEGHRVDLARMKVSNPWQLTEFYRHEERLITAAAFGRRMRAVGRKNPGTCPPLPESIWALAHLVFCDRAGEVTATDFLERQLAYGDGISKGDPAMAARNRLLSADRTSERLDETQRCYIVWRGWNGFRGHLRFDKIQLPADRNGKKRHIRADEFDDAF